MNFVLCLARPVRRGTLSRGVVRVGRERRLRPGSREPRAREAKANSGAPRVSEDHRRLIRPPRTRTDVGP